MVLRSFTILEVASSEVVFSTCFDPASTGAMPEQRAEWEKLLASETSPFWAADTSVDHVAMCR